MQINNSGKFYTDPFFIGEQVSVSFGNPNPPTPVMSPRKSRLMEALRNYFASQGRPLTDVGWSNASNWMNEIYNGNKAVTDQEILNRVAYWILNGR